MLPHPPGEGCCSATIRSPLYLARGEQGRWTLAAKAVIERTPQDIQDGFCSVDGKTCLDGTANAGSDWVASRLPTRRAVHMRLSERLAYLLLGHGPRVEVGPWDWISILLPSSV